jgi:hypothetical protein
MAAAKPVVLAIDGPIRQLVDRQRWLVETRGCAGQARGRPACRATQVAAKWAAGPGGMALSTGANWRSSGARFAEP